MLNLSIAEREGEEWWAEAVAAAYESNMADADLLEAFRAIREHGNLGASYAEVEAYVSAQRYSATAETEACRLWWCWNGLAGFFK